MILARKYVISHQVHSPEAISLIQLKKDFPASWYLLTKVSSCTWRQDIQCSGLEGSVYKANQMFPGTEVPVFDFTYPETVCFHLFQYNSNLELQ